MSYDATIEIVPLPAAFEIPDSAAALGGLPAAIEFLPPVLIEVPEVAIAAGTPGVIWVGDWQFGAGYLPLYGVQRNGASYRAIQVNVGSSANEPGVGPYWTEFWSLLADRGGKGDRGEQGPPGVLGDGQIIDGGFF